MADLIFKDFSSKPSKFKYFSSLCEPCLTHVSVEKKENEPVHEISNNVACATSKASDQPVHMRSLIRAFATRLSIL